MTKLHPVCYYFRHHNCDNKYIRKTYVKSRHYRVKNTLRYRKATSLRTAYQIIEESDIFMRHL